MTEKILQEVDRLEAENARLRAEIADLRESYDEDTAICACGRTMVFTKVRAVCADNARLQCRSSTLLATLELVEAYFLMHAEERPERETATVIEEIQREISDARNDRHLRFDALTAQVSKLTVLSAELVEGCERAAGCITGYLQIRESEGIRDVRQALRDLIARAKRAGDEQ